MEQPEEGEDCADGRPAKRTRRSGLDESPIADTRDAIAGNCGGADGGADGGGTDDGGTDDGGAYDGSEDDGGAYDGSADDGGADDDCADDGSADDGDAVPVERRWRRLEEGNLR